MRIRILIPDEPNIRYSKQDLLALPELKPFRHYESEGLGSVSQRTKEETKLPPAVETLKDLQSVYNLADLYPPGLSKIIKDITEILMLDTQGRIIIDVNRNTKTPDDNENPKPGPEQVTPPQPENPVGPTPPITPTPVEPVPPTEYEPPEEKPPTITVQPKIGPVSFEPLVDVFSKKPVFKLQLDPKKSLVQLSREADASDDNAIKKYYTSKMIQISMRFFTVMCTLSDEAHMPDYSYLMMPFDGTAVSTTDPNQRHLIDKICKNQVTYDQRERQMNKTHTAKNMLIMTRGRASAEAQRERYFEEQYKKQQPTYSSTFSNDLLEASRAEANEKYQQSSYNMFKFLDSATKITNSLLNTTIDSATAKSQLSQTGSDIFAQTPPPAATPDHIDDNFDETNKMNDKAKKMIADQKKNAVAGGSGGGGGGNVNGYHGLPLRGSGIDTFAPHPNIPGDGVERWAPYVVDAIAANGLEPTDDRLSRILRQIETESSGDPGAVQQVHDCNSGGNEAQGLMQVIPPTFEANSFSGHTDPHNGYDSLLAAIHYIIAAYGEDFNGIGEGHGY